VKIRLSGVIHHKDFEKLVGPSDFLEVFHELDDPLQRAGQNWR
jgi:hypothetical protein